jgi:plasmid stabilization system protein ParE
MPKPVIWSELSVNDFSMILQYLRENWNDQIVNRFIDITEDLISQISNNPKQFPFINKRHKIRKCVITKHNTLYYRERRDLIDVLRIYDNRQDPKKLRFK